MADLVLSIVCLSVFAASGLVVLLAVSGFRPPSDMGWPLIGAVSFVVGSGVVSLQLFVYSLVHLPFRVATVSIPWVILLSGVGVLSVARSGRSNVRSSSTDGLDPERRGSWLLAGGVAVVVIQSVYCVVFSLSKPITAWDSWAIWFFKAKAFFVSGGLPSAHFFSTAYLHPDYPLLTPLAVAWHYICLGRVDEQVGKLIFPLSFLALLLMFGYTLKKETGRDNAALFTALLSLTPIVVMHAGGLSTSADFVGYADLSLSLYFWGAAAYLYIYQKNGQPVWFLLAALFLGMGAWTKNEGLTYAAVGSVLLIVSAKSWRLAGAGLSLIAVFVMPWMLFKEAMSLENDVVGQARWLGLGSSIDRLFTISEWAWRSIAGGKFGLLWVGFVVSSALNWRRMINTPLRSCAILGGLQFVVYVGVYLVTPRDLEWHLVTSIDRVLLHLAPLALWVTALNVYQLLEEIEKARSSGQGSRLQARLGDTAEEGVVR